MLQNFLKKLADDAAEKDQKVTLDDLIKSAVLDNKNLDDAVRELRKAINKNEIDPNHFDTKVLMLTHRNEMKGIIDIYRKETGKDLTQDQKHNLKAEIENSAEVKSEFKNEVEKKSNLMTPFDFAKNPFKLT